MSKPTSKFILDMIYGIEKSKSVLFSNIARALDEDIKLGYTIERLCDNCNNLSKNEVSIIKNNYFDEAMKKLLTLKIIYESKSLKIKH